MAHSRSFLANQKARNAIVGAENLLHYQKFESYASPIPHVNQMEQKRWLPDVVKKYMGSKIKYQFSAVQIN